MRTRAQEDMILAAKALTVVQGKGKETHGIYGSLCHSFPIMVRTCGLCQAVAFSAAKAKARESSRKEAHELLLKHVGELIGLREATADDVLRTVREADAAAYMLHTRRILAAWIYYKRFAVSILEVENARDEESGEAIAHAA